MSVMPHVFFLCIRIDFVVPSVGHRVVFFMSDQCKIEFINDLVCWARRVLKSCVKQLHPWRGAQLLLDLCLCYAILRVVRLIMFCRSACSGQSI